MILVRMLVVEIVCMVVLFLMMVLVGMGSMGSWLLLMCIRVGLSCRLCIVCCIVSIVVCRMLMWLIFLWVVCVM